VFNLLWCLNKVKVMLKAQVFWDITPWRLVNSFFSLKTQCSFEHQQLFTNQHCVYPRRLGSPVTPLWESEIIIRGKVAPLLPQSQSGVAVCSLLTSAVEGTEWSASCPSKFKTRYLPIHLAAGWSRVSFCGQEVSLLSVLGSNQEFAFVHSVA